LGGPGVFVQLSLSQIGEEVTQIDHDLDMDWLSQLLSGKHTADFRVVGGHRARIFARRMGLDVHLSGECTLKLKTECAACMATYDLEVPVAFSLTLKPRPNSGQTLSDDVELSKEDLEECYYQGDVIDLTDILREQIILALPMYPRCSPDCRGLCPVCGINLNQETCDCQREEVDPRLAVLKTLTKN
jgi:uncharacterized protein